MKNVLLILFLFVLIKSAEAQVTYHFHHTNATWGQFDGVYYQPMGFNGYYTGGTNFQTATGDTFVKGNIYIKICSEGPDSSGASVTCNLPRLIREEGSKIFYFDDNSQADTLLYDFSLQPGDSILPYTEYEYPPHYIHVDSIGFIIIGTEQRKCIYFNYPAAYNAFCGATYTCVKYLPLTWIEGIGSTDGLFQTYGGADIVDGIAFLTCYRENDTLKYGNNCGLVVYDGINEASRTFLSLYPNPAVDVIKIRLNHTVLQNTIATLYSADGRMVRSGIIDNSITDYPIEVHSLPSGLYVMHLQNGNESFSEKFEIAR